MSSELDNLIDYSKIGLFDKKSNDIYSFIYSLTKNYEKDLEKLFIQYQRFYLPYLICSHTDKANMKYSIEARSLFEQKLFEYVNSFNRNELINKMKSKKILRNFLYKQNGLYCKAKKKGFTIPFYG